MSEGSFGNNVDLAQRLKDRIAYHANEHRHTYEIGKRVFLTKEAAEAALEGEGAQKE